MYFWMEPMAYTWIETKKKAEQLFIETPITETTTKREQDRRFAASTMQI